MLPIRNLSAVCECKIVGQITVSETNAAENDSKNGVQPIGCVSRRAQDADVSVCARLCCVCVWGGLKLSEPEPMHEATQSGQIIAVLNVTGFD